MGFIPRRRYDGDATELPAVDQVIINIITLSRIDPANVDMLCGPMGVVKQVGITFSMRIPVVDQYSLSRVGSKNARLRQYLIVITVIIKLVMVDRVSIAVSTLYPVIDHGMNDIISARYIMLIL
jgi:hypothetical protein